MEFVALSKIEPIGTDRDDWNAAIGAWASAISVNPKASISDFKIDWAQNSEQNASSISEDQAEKDFAEFGKYIEKMRLRKNGS